MVFFLRALRGGRLHGSERIGMREPVVPQFDAET
jgi:hypothetical protein